MLFRSPALGALCLRCDGSHDHLPWGVLPDGTFSTAAEAEYPTLLCSRLAEAVVASAVTRGYSMPETIEQSDHLQLNAMAVHRQATKSMPQYLSEFAYVTEVLVTKSEPVLDHKGKLIQPFHFVPAGAKRLKTVRKRVGKDFWYFHDVWSL